MSSTAARSMRRAATTSESAPIFDRMRAKYGFTVDHRDRREPARAAAPAIAPGTQLALGVR